VNSQTATSTGRMTFQPVATISTPPVPREAPSTPPEWSTLSAADFRAAILADRWLMATTRERRDHEGIALVGFRPDNSDAVEAILDGIEDIAARLVGEVPPNDMDSLLEVASGLLEGPIKTALLEWAAR
jgi:hypothetical protein